MLYFKRNQGQVAFNPVLPELSIQLLPFKHPGLWVLFLKYMKESNITSSAMTTCLQMFYHGVPNKHKGTKCSQEGKT